MWLLYVCVSFFFFKQKTAYEMRISDWSSDVCSSDLYESPSSTPSTCRDRGTSHDVSSAIESTDRTNPRCQSSSAGGVAAKAAGYASRRATSHTSLISAVRDRTSTRLNSSH